MAMRVDLKSSRRTLALEPRLLFDGAAAVAGADVLMDGDVPDLQDAPAENGGQTPNNGIDPTEVSSFDEDEALIMPMGMMPFGLGEEADVTISDSIDDRGMAIGLGENAVNVMIAGGIEITGDGDYTVTVSVDRGQLSVDGGTASSEMTFTGDASSIQAEINSLQYTYTGGSEVGDEDALTIRITDEHDTTITHTRGIVITAENDEPEIIPNGVPDDVAGDLNPKSYKPLEVDEGGSTSFDPVLKLNNGKNDTELGAWHHQLGLYDPDNTAEQIIIKLGEGPDYGTLKLGDVTLVAGSTFSLDEIDQLKYVHDGSQVLEAHQDSFSINIDDGAGGLLINEEVFIDLLPVNQAPSIAGKDSLVIIQGEGPVNLGLGGSLPVIGGSRGQLEGKDPDDNALEYIITSLPNEGEGVLYYEGSLVEENQVIEDLTKLTFEYPTDLEPTDLSVNGKVEFTIEVTDQGGGEGLDHALVTEETISIVVLDNNNDPYFDGVELTDLELARDDQGEVIPDVLVIHEIDYAEAVEAGSNTIVITVDMLPLTDADSAVGSLVYTITDSNASQAGYFTVQGSDGPKRLDRDGSDYATFTQEDVAEGRVQYHLFGNGPVGGRLDYIEFTIKDGAKTIVFDDDHEGGGYARDGGIYLADFTYDHETPNGDEGLQKFRLNVQVPEAAQGGHGGILPDIPGIGAAIEISGDRKAEVDESGSVTLTEDELIAVDGIGSSVDKIVFRIEKVPAYGDLYRGESKLKLHDSFSQADINSGAISYRHHGSERFDDDFHFSVSNGDIVTSSADNQFSFEVTPQNDSPTASGEDVTVGEGRAVEIGITLSDPDNDGAYDHGRYDQENQVGYRVDTLPEHGTLYLVPEGFVTKDFGFNNLPSGQNVIEVVQGAVFEANELESKKLIYVHDGSENYTGIEFKITPIDDARVGINPDGSTAGVDAVTATNQSSEGAQETIKIDVTPRNDAPIFVEKKEPIKEGDDDRRIWEGDAVTIWGATSYDKDATGNGKDGSGKATPNTSEDYYLVYEDADNSSTQRQYRITEAPEHGTLMLDGTPLGVGGVFTQADLDTGKITYKHDGSENHSDGFEYVVSDGDWTVNEKSAGALSSKDADIANGIYPQNDRDSIESSRFNIQVKPTNNAPEISRIPADGVDDDHIIVDSTDPAKAAFLGQFTIVDPDIDDAPEGQDDIEDHIRVTVELPDDLRLVLPEGEPEGHGVIIISEEGTELVFEGARDDVQNYLDTLKVRIAEGRDPNQKLTITVTVDDRIYDGDEVKGTNGGERNKDGAPIGDDFNTDSVEIEVWASAENNPPEIEDAPESVVINEDGWNGSSYNSGGRSKLELNDIEIQDPDAFDTEDNTLTLSVTHGNLFFGQTGTGAPKDTTVKEGAIGSETVTLQGTREALEEALNSIYYASKQEHFNGHDQLEIVVDDGGNIGQDNDPDTTDTRTVDIHILPVNDKPQLGGFYQEGSVGNPGDEITEDGYVTLNDVYEFSAGKGNAISFVDVDRKPESDGFDEVVTGHQYADPDAEYTITLEAIVDDSGFGQIKLKDGYNPDLITIDELSDGKLTLTGTYEALDTTLKYGVIYDLTNVDAADDIEDANIKFTITVNDNGDGGTELEDNDATDEEGKLKGLRDGLEDSFSFFFQRTDKNDPPQFGFGGSDTSDDDANIFERERPFVAHDDVSAREPVQLDPDAKVTDEELDLFSENGGSWDGAVLTLERADTDEHAEEFATSPRPADEFGFTSDVTISGSDVMVGDNIVGEILKNADGTLQIRFTDKASSEDVNTVLQSITYLNTESSAQLEAYGNSASVDIIYRMDDGNSNFDPTKEGDEVDNDSKWEEGQNQGTGGNLTGFGKITVDINRQVVAEPDTNTVTEPAEFGSTPSDEDDGLVTGDLTPGDDNNDHALKEQDYDPDVDDDIIVEGIKNYDDDEIAIDATGDTDNDGRGTEITGQYGTLYVKSDGHYTYIVDASNLDVQGLVPGENRLETFEYTVNDGRGEDSTSATSNLTITIQGANDPVDLVVPEPPEEVVYPGEGTDKDPKDHVVFESGLAGGSHPDSSHITVTDSFTINALDGLDPADALTLTVGLEKLVLKPEDLEDLSDTPKSITTTYGTLELNGYEKDGDTGEITISYTYTLVSDADHDPEVADGKIFDEITITAKDRGGNQGSADPDDEGQGIDDGKDTNTQTLRIRVMDDRPAADDDTNTVGSGQSTTGGVLTNDHAGADGWKLDAEDSIAAVVGVEAGANGEPQTGGAGTAIEGAHGTLTLNPDGSYTYQAKPDTPDGSKDTFTYTVEDADGDQATAELVITITEVVFAPVDTSGTVYEAGLEGGSGGENQPAVIENASLELQPDINVAFEQSGSGDYGSFTVHTDGTYSYELDKSAEHDGEVTDTFTYTAQDEFGNTVQNTITVTIVDDKPEAADDANTVNNQTNKAEGNVLTNDKSGGDGWKLDGEEIAAVVGVEAGENGEPQTDGVGSVIQGDHGTLTLNSDGSYTYEANPDAPDGSTDTFTYTVEDADGDQATAELVISIIEVVFVPVDTFGTVYEAGLEGGSGGEDQPAVIQNASLELQPDVSVAVEQSGSGDYGSFTVHTDGTYSYELDKSVEHDGEVTDTFTYTAQDAFGNTVQNTITVTIVDDKPEATDDTNTVNNQTNKAEGNVLTNDKSGADGWKLDGEEIAAVVGVEAGEDDEPQTDGVGSAIQGAHGKLTLNADGSYTYVRDSDEPTDGEITDVFTYMVQDSDGDTATATLTITINDQGPVFTDGDDPLTPDRSVHEGGLDGGSLENDLDKPHTTTGEINFNRGDGDGNDHEVTITGEDGDPVKLTPGEQTTIATPHGKVIITEFDPEEGVIRYEYELTEPTDGENTFDSFDILITDEDGDAVEATVRIDIINDTPTASNDHNSVRAGDTIQDSVLGNDHAGADGWRSGGAVIGVFPGAGGTPESGTGTSIQGQYGTLVLQPDGSYTYTAKPNTPDGSIDTFTYTVEDTDGDQATAELEITISMPNWGDSTSTTEVREAHLPGGSDPQPEDAQTSGTTRVTNPDDPTETSGLTGLDLKDGEGPKYGTVEFDEGSQTYTYTLNDSVDSTEITEDTFTYTGKDDYGNSVERTVTVRIINDTPTAINDHNSVRAGDSVQDSVLGNDHAGADGWRSGGAVIGVSPGAGGTPDSGTGTSIQGQYGTLVLQSDGSYTYTANPGVGNQVDVFTYTVEDADGDRATATLTIEVLNQPPVAQPDSSTVEVNTPATGNVLENDRDPDDDDITVVEFTVDGKTYQPGETAKIPGVGEITMDEDGSYIFTPEDDWSGSVPAVEYRIDDGRGGQDTSTLDITVLAPEPEPEPEPELPVDPEPDPDPQPPVDPVDPETPEPPAPEADWQPDPEYDHRPEQVPDRQPSDLSGGRPLDNTTAERPLNPLKGDRAGNHSLYFHGSVHHKIPLMEQPFHPIVYVNQEVVSSQMERDRIDDRINARSDWVDAGVWREVPIGLGLGHDPTLFVHRAVRGAQAYAYRMGLVVEGRLSRVSLSSDDLLPTPGLHAVDSDAMIGGEQPQEAATAEPIEVPINEDAAPAEAEASESPDDLAAIPDWSMELAYDTATQETTAQVSGAQSFSDMLRANQRLLF